MLIIKRKTNESILIGDNNVTLSEPIEIIISEISGDKVKIAINAPADVRIIRKEIKETSEFNKTAVVDISKEKMEVLKAGLKKKQ
jgi:carbon storage regulator